MTKITPPKKLKQKKEFYCKLTQVKTDKCVVHEETLSDGGDAGLCPGKGQNQWTMENNYVIAPTSDGWMDQANWDGVSSVAKRVLCFRLACQGSRL